MRRTKTATAAVAIILALLAGTRVTRPTILELEALRKETREKFGSDEGK